MRRFAVLAVGLPLLGVASSAQQRTVSGIRHWQLGEVTRVAVEVSGSFQTRSDRLHDPERVYYDILNARPWINEKRAYTEMVNDRLLTRIRVAETVPGVTRVVLYLANGVEATTSELVNPNRLMIELHEVAETPQPVQPPAPPVPTSARPKPRTTEEAAVSKPPAEPPVVPAVEPVVKAIPAAVTTAVAEPPVSAKAETPQIETARLEVAKAEPVKAPESPTAPATIPVSGESGRPARRNSDGESSMVRALGLKINRVVLDPGHGGHDEGTMGPKGLLEKDLVLDVAQRLGKLIEQRMGAEVIYTRTDDTFIPLEGRTELANEKKADLFLSIHANSSPARNVTGIETYYLNFTQSKDALDVATRENASSQKSVFELRDLIQKITLQDKAEESREFAGRVQASLEAFSARSFPGEKNRGVRRAPFVVLIGANMPSVLAEIGFLSNAREEALLRKPEYRQKLAEALYRGVSRYAGSLSHFQVAQGKKD